jgi:ribosome-associated translation inhibitor RaiA
MDYIQVTLADKVPEQARDYASARIGELDRYAPAPVDFAWIGLTTASGQSQSVMAHARLDLKWIEVQAYAEAGTSTEVIDLVRERLRRQLVNMHN